MQDSHDEVIKLLDLMGLRGQVRVEDGAPTRCPTSQTPVHLARRSPDHRRGDEGRSPVRCTSPSTGRSPTWLRPSCWSPNRRAEYPGRLDRRRAVAAVAGGSLTSPTTSTRPTSSSLPAGGVAGPQPSTAPCGQLRRADGEGLPARRARQYLVEQLIEWNATYAGPISSSARWETRRVSADHSRPQLRPMGVEAGAGL